MSGDLDSLTTDHAVSELGHPDVRVFAHSIATASSRRVRDWHGLQHQTHTAAAEGHFKKALRSSACYSVSVCRCLSMSVNVCQCLSVSVCQCLSVSVSICAVSVCLSTCLVCRTCNCVMRARANTTLLASYPQSHQILWRHG